jgi:hypothetical protein
MHEYWNNLSRNIKPLFHELSAYLVALALGCLFVYHSELRQGLYQFFVGFGPLFILLGLFLAGGWLLSLVHVFIRRRRSAIEKMLIGYFLLTTSAVASFFMASEMLPSSPTLVILPVWNILMSLLLLIQMVAGNYSLSDDDASFRGVLLTTAVLAAILWAADSLLQLSLATTLSICIFFATSIVYLPARIARIFNARLPGSSE